MIDWNHFTPLSAAGGGALIGFAAALLYVGEGRIAGISGILTRTVTLAKEGRAWRLAFLLGLLLAPWRSPFSTAVAAADLSPGTLAILLLAGVLTGYGTRLSGGCTSGHGVCGLSRLSLRSLAAVAGFMGSGMVTVWVLRHLIGMS